MTLPRALALCQRLEAERRGRYSVRRSGRRSLWVTPFYVKRESA